MLKFLYILLTANRTIIAIFGRYFSTHKLAFHSPVFLNYNFSRRFTRTTHKVFDFLGFTIYFPDSVISTDLFSKFYCSLYWSLHLVAILKQWKCIETWTISICVFSFSEFFFIFLRFYVCVCLYACMRVSIFEPV